MHVKRMAIVKIIIQGRAGHFIDKKKKKKLMLIYYSIPREVWQVTRYERKSEPKSCSLMLAM